MYKIRWTYIFAYGRFLSHCLVINNIQTEFVVHMDLEQGDNTAPYSIKQHVGGSFYLQYYNELALAKYDLIQRFFAENHFLKTPESFYDFATYVQKIYDVSIDNAESYVTMRILKNIWI